MKRAELTAAAVVAGAFVGAAISSSSPDVQQPVPAIATIDAPLGAHATETLSVNVALGSRPTGVVEYDGQQPVTDRVAFQDIAGYQLRSGEVVAGSTTLLVTVTNTTDAPVRIAGFVHYNPPAK